MSTITLNAWITVSKAEEITGLPSSWFADKTTDGTLAEGRVWKWAHGRKLIDLQALHDYISSVPSVPSRRGRRPEKIAA